MAHITLDALKRRLARLDGGGLGKGGVQTIHIRFVDPCGAAEEATSAMTPDGVQRFSRLPSETEASFLERAAAGVALLPKCRAVLMVE